MRRKKQFLMAALCAFSMLVNSAAVVAQSKDKKQEPQSGAQQAPEPPSDNLLLPAPSLHISRIPQDIAYGAPQVQFIHNEFSFDSKLVKGAPYSADAVTETVQTLGDGNRIVNSSSSKIYRDSAGRTRREHAFKAIGPWAVSGEFPVMISINDPVAGVTYNLNSNMKTAHKMAMPRLAGLSEIAKDRAELMEKIAKMKAANGAEAGVSVGNEVVIKEGSSVAYSSVARSGVATGPVGGAVISGVRPGIPMSAGSMGFSWSSEGEVNQEQLGTQTIEGVVAEGTRVTFTIAAGKIGNERPIVTVNERWYSPELQTVVMTKNSDPRMGETTFRLTNIDRSEPDPSLFQVPADYTVEEGGFSIRPIPPDFPRKKRRPNEN